MVQEKLIEFAKQHIADGQQELIDTIKLLVYKAEPALFDQLDFENDRIFQEPYLFAYFKDPSSKVRLPQLLFGYIERSIRPSAIRVFADHRGIVYLPNIGYFKTAVPDTDLILEYNHTPEAFRLIFEEHLIEYIFEEILTIKGTDIELCRYPHPFLPPFLRNRAGLPTEVEIESLVLKHKSALDRAFDMIRVTFPSYYEDIVATTRKVIVFHHPEVRSLASVQIHGAAFFQVEEDASEIFFVEDIAHQCGHIIFSAMTFHTREFIAIDPHTPLINYNKREDETRQVYEALHGVFTEVTINQCLDKIQDAYMLSPRLEHELLGRLAMYLLKASIDVQNLGHREIFSEKGWALLNDFREVCADIYLHHEDLENRFDFSNQVYTFSYEKFAERNPMKIE